MSGGPGKDGIPAIDEQRFVRVEEASRWIEDKEPVIELAVGSDVRVIRCKILIWHEIINDEVGGVSPRRDSRSPS